MVARGICVLTRVLLTSDILLKKYGDMRFPKDCSDIQFLLFYNLPDNSYNTSVVLWDLQKPLTINMNNVDVFLKKAPLIISS